MKLRIVALCVFAGLGALLLTAPSASAQILNKNHYLCRKVKDLKIPAKFVDQTVTTADEVGADTCDLKKLFLLCSPTSKNGSLIDDGALHYCCYKSKCGTKTAVNFSLTDQFGTLTVQTKKPFLLCNPCTATY